MNAEPVIGIRKNASTRSKGSKQLKDAGRRWIAEILFSSIKRVFDEDLLSKKFKAEKVSRSWIESDSIQ